MAATLIPWRHPHPPQLVESPCGTHLYQLQHIWDRDKPILGWALLTGCDAGQDRARRYARAWGYGGVTICALYPLHTNSLTSALSHSDPTGPDNPHHLAALVLNHSLTVLAWGPTAPRTRAHAAATLLWRTCAQSRNSLAVLGWTANRQPQHPLATESHRFLHCLTPARAGAPTQVHELDDPHWTHLLGPAAAAAA